MNKYKLNILFVIANNRTRKDGKAPIICRLTYKSKRKEFATGQFTNPDYWKSKDQMASPPNENYVNNQLSLISQKLNQAFLLLQFKEVDFNVDDIYNSFLGKKSNAEKTIKDAFEYHTNRMQKLVGIDVKQVSVQKYFQTLEHVKTFLKFKYNKNDYLLKDLKMNFINDFEYYLKTEKKFKPHSVYKAIQRFRRVIRVSVSADYILKDPFVFHKIKKPKKQIVYLTQTELASLEKHKFSQVRLEQVRDCFIFCCYTGLAFQEMTNLDAKNIIKGFDGKQWISMERQKTGKQFSIPLLLKPKKILENFLRSSNDSNNKLLPIISNQKFNSYLKEIAEIVGIDKNLTHHIARKTFATTVLLYNDVPMEIVSELLGHSKMSITQEHYGKIVQKKVSEQMIFLSKKLNLKNNK
ncbi:integrase [bacterium BRH_c32]|nr:MAG: integrase [bacterium BRH_c32]